jgi:gliding motility-associated-like protein
VHPLPVAQFSRVNVCDGTSVQFNDLSTIANPDVIQFWTYSFGDGNFGTTPGPSHLYASPGSYIVKLLTVTSFGCKDSISKTSIVHPNPVTDFVAPITVGCEPLCVNFKDTSTILTGLNAHYLWNVGDGSATHTTPTFTHCYTNDSIFAANTFNVTLTVTSDSGCVTTKVKNNFVTVYPNPKASFIVHPESTTITDPIITFTDLSTGATIWNWNMGDNATSSIESPTPHTYQDTGTYVVTLITSTQYLCKDTTHQTVIIEPDFMFYIPSAFTPDGDGINDSFTGKGIFVKEFKMSIFDRWGNMIFYTDDIKIPWDGTANHGTDKAQRDVYVYSIDVIDYKKKKHNYKGTVTLMR